MTPEIQLALRTQLQGIIELLSASGADQNPARSSIPGALDLSGACSEPHASTDAARDSTLTNEQIAVGQLRIDLAGREVLSGGCRVHLTYREFSLLVYLVEQRGRACTREQIVAHVWVDRELMSDRTVDIHVHRLRAKLGEPFAELIETVRHVGYKVRVAPTRSTLRDEELAGCMIPTWDALSRRLDSLSESRS